MHLVRQCKESSCAAIQRALKIVENSAKAHVQHLQSKLADTRPLVRAQARGDIGMEAGLFLGAMYCVVTGDYRLLYPFAAAGIGAALGFNYDRVKVCFLGKTPARRDGQEAMHRNIEWPRMRRLT